MKANILAAGLILVGCALATEVSAQVTSSRDGRSVIYKGPANAAEPDYANAQPLLLPKPAFKPAVGPLNHHAPLHEKSGVMPGGRGDGKESPENIPAQKHSAVRNNLGVTPEDAGPTCGIVCQFPFTTNRADPYFTTTTKYYPFRAAGKLFFNIGSSAYLCSASLIGQGLVVTAARTTVSPSSTRTGSSSRPIPTATRHTGNGRRQAHRSSRPITTGRITVPSMASFARMT